MVMGRWLKLLLMSVVASIVPACSARADVEQVIEPVVIPGIVDGHQRGCDLAFHIARGFTGDTFSSAIGATISLYASDESHWVGALKIGFQPRPGVVLPPETAFLMVGDATNENEVAQFYPANEHGYIRLTFAGAENTAAAFNELADTGTATIGMRMPNGEATVWSLNLADRQDVRDAWQRCLAGIEGL
jgi:hypothetical protein